MDLEITNRDLHTHQMAPKSTSFFFPSVFVDTFEENLVFFFQFSMRFETKSHSFFIDLIVRVCQSKVAERVYGEDVGRRRGRMAV